MLCLESMLDSLNLLQSFNFSKNISCFDHLLFKNFHDCILNAIAQFRVLDSILEELLGVDEILAVGVASGAQDHYHAAGVTTKGTYSTRDR